MRGVSKLLLAGALALLLTMGIAACGGDDSGDSTAASTATTTEEPVPGQSSSDEQEGSGGESGGSDGSSQGEGSAAFLTPGGDNSIQQYGAEADDEEREAASAAVLAYMEARADSDWEAVCEHMADATLEPFEEFTDKTGQLKGKKCPEILETLTGSAPASSRTNMAADGVASFRFEDDQGFALYHGTDGTDYFLPLVKENGQWKVGALAPTALP